MGLIRYRDIIEPYMPDRVLRQLGYVQVIPVDILTPDCSHVRRQVPRIYSGIDLTDISEIMPTVPWRLQT